MFLISFYVKQFSTSNPTFPGNTTAEPNLRRDKNETVWHPCNGVFAHRKYFDRMS